MAVKIEILQRNDLAKTILITMCCAGESFLQTPDHLVKRSFKIADEFMAREDRENAELQNRVADYDPAFDRS